MISKIPPWKAVYLSWFSPEIYREAAFCWRGLGYRYLVVLLVCLWAIVALHVHIVVNQYAEGFLRPVMKALPKIEIKEGLLTIDRPDQHLQITDPRNGRLVVSFDLTKEPVAPKLNEDGIFLERKRVIFHYQGKEQVYDFTSISDSTYDWSYYLKGLSVIENWFGITVLLLFWLISFIVCALQVLVYALLGKLIAIVNKCHLTYPQLVRISTVALTPVLIIDACQKLLCAGIPAWTVVSVGIAMLYLVFGVRANSLGFTWSLSQESKVLPVAKDSAS